MSVAAFYSWQKKLGAGKSGGRSTSGIALPAKPTPSLPKASFLPVRIAQQGEARLASPCIEIRLANGARIFVPSTDANTIQAVVESASRITVSSTTDLDHDRGVVEDAAC